MAQAKIHTRRLSLEPLQAVDRPDLHELDVNPEVMRYIYTGKPLSEAEAEMSFNTLLEIGKIDKGLGCWVGRDDKNNFVGWWVVATPPAPKEQSSDQPLATTPTTKLQSGEESTPKYDGSRVEIGMRVAPEYQGKGFAKEGTQALLKHCFEDLNKTQVYGETMTVNAPCRALMDKCGMEHVRTWHNTYDQFTPAPGIEEGEVEHRITREQWVSKARLASAA